MKIVLYFTLLAFAVNGFSQVQLEGQLGGSNFVGITMNTSLRINLMQRGFSLKSIVVKNFEETSGKRAQKELWRYRALLGGFYVFKHESIFLFKKQ